MKCAVFIAANSSGSAGNWITQIIQCRPQISIDDFIYVFDQFKNDMSSKIDVATALRCSKICADFQLSLKMYNKFDSVWSKLEFKDKFFQKACVEKLKKTAWFLYLIGK